MFSDELACTATEAHHQLAAYPKHQPFSTDPLSLRTLILKHRNNHMLYDHIIRAVETHFKNLGFLGFFKKPKKPEKLGF